MHPTPVFEWTARSELLEFVRERAFATLIAVIDGRPCIAQVPVIVDGDTLRLHLSRANPLARVLPTRVTAVVAGPDAYVSPDWYVEPAQVPTWNYVSVEIEGELAPTDERTLTEILEQQSQTFERRIADKPPWTIDKLPPAVLAAKLKGIVGGTLAITAIRGTRKLSQNKTPADRHGVIAQLAASEREMDRAIAQAMRE